MLQGLQDIIIAQGAQPFPPQALAAQLRPYRVKPGTTARLGLIHQQRQPHAHGTYDRAMVLAMPVMVCTVVALGFQCMEGLVRNVPAGSSTPPEVKDVALAYPQGRDPTAVLDLVWAHLPGRDASDAHVRVRGIERHVMDQPTARHTTHGAVVPVVIGHAPVVLRRLPLLEQQGLITFCAAEDSVTTIIVPGLKVRGMGTQAIFRHATLEVRVVLAQLGNNALAGMARASVCRCTILVHHRVGPERNHCPLLWMDDRRAQQLVIRGDRPMAVDRVPTRRTVQGMGGNIPCAITGHERVAIQTD